MQKLVKSNLTDTKHKKVMETQRENFLIFSEANSIQDFIKKVTINESELGPFPEKEIVIPEKNKLK